MIKYLSNNNPDIPKDTQDIITDYLNSFRDSDDDFPVPENFATMFAGSQMSLVNQYYEKYSELDYNFIIVVGIGGANLGIEVVYSALRAKKQIIFLENVDPITNDECIKAISDNYQNGEKALLFVASKSGSTTETMSNFAIVLDVFKNLEPDWQKRTIATTLKDSILDKIATREGFDAIYVPEQLADRFSIMGISTLLALKLAGFDTDQMVSGAQEMNDMVFNKDYSENIAMQYAFKIFSTKHSMVNFFIFSDMLERYGAWQRQLFAESLGKNSSSKTPIITIGTTDLHSITQLYLAGPRDKYTSFISIGSYSSNNVVNDDTLADSPISGLGGKSYAEIFKIIEEGVKTTYRKQKLPFDEIILDGLNEKSIGALVQFQMLTVAIIGKLENINTFDQPAVELYKNEIRALI